MKYVKKALFSAVLLLLFVVATPLLFNGRVAAAEAQGVCGTENSSFLGFPTWYKYLEPVEKDGSCDISLGSGPEEQLAGVGKILLAVFEIALRAIGILAIGYVMYGGFQYLISQGEPDKTKSARSTILNALIGVAISVSAVAIVNIIGRNIG